MPPSSPQAWPADLRQRMVTMFALKFVGVSAFTWVFFLGYFHLLRHPAYPVTVMPLTALDRWIPFQPAALIAYLSLWVYVGFAPGLLRDLRELLLYGLWAAALCATGLALFYLFPTTVPLLNRSDTGFPGFAAMEGVDAAGNACPSMHVAIAVFSAVWIDHVFRVAGAPSALRATAAAWCLAIVWSTLAVKQHVVLDAIAGAALGAAFAWPSLRWRPVANPGMEWISSVPAEGLQSGPVRGSAEGTADLRHHDGHRT